MVSEARRTRLLSALTGIIVLAYFLFFTWRGVRLYFDQDDMMNLYMAWRQPWGRILQANVFFWSESYRPLGTLFYRALYAVAGFNPLPFRIACLAIGAFNIVLCWRFTRLVSSSNRVSALAILIFAFQPRLLEVWYRNSVIYDLACFTFFYGAACLFLAARRRGEWPRAGRAMAICACYVCALNLKEMAVALPLVLLAYELLFHRAAWKQFRLIAAMSLATLPYVFFKTHGSSALANNVFYRPEYSWARFMHTSERYTNYVFMRTDIAPWGALLILAGMLAAALVFRSRHLVLAWIILFAGTLPVLFIPDRGGFVLYIAWMGWVLYAAVALVAVQDFALRGSPNETRQTRYRPALACLVFLVVGWRLGKMNLHDQRVDPRPWLTEAPAAIQTMVSQLRAFQPSFPRGARMLFLEDAFSTDEWTPYFIMKLAWHDDTLVVDRLKMMSRKPGDWRDYPYVFTYQNGTYRQLKPER